MPPLLVYCDGLCEPTNPGGYACWAYIVFEGECKIQQDYGCLGHGPGMTNNLAEYRAVIRALGWLKDNVLDGVRVRTDSQLVVRQLLGEYAVRSPAIVPLYQEAMVLVRAISPVLEWVRREQNTLADTLTRQAYAEARGFTPLTPIEKDDPIMLVLGRLDTMEREVTDWEGSFLQSIMKQIRQGRSLSPKQRAIIQRMAEQYLSAEAGAEIAGQRRMF